MPPGVKKTAFLHIFFKVSNMIKNLEKNPTYLRQNTDFKNGRYHALNFHATNVLLVIYLSLVSQIKIEGLELESRTYLRMSLTHRGSK